MNARVATTVLATIALVAITAKGATMTETTALDLNGVKAVTASTFNGDVTLSVTAEPAQLEAHKQGDVIVDHRRDGDTLVIEARSRTVICPRCKVDLKLNLPANLALKLSTGNGDVSANGPARSLDGHSGNGDVTASGVKNAKLKLTSGNGDVTARDASGEVAATTGNGAVRLERFSFAAGSRNTMSTGNGSITVIAPAGPGGLRISGKAVVGTAAVNLNGFEVSIKRGVVGGSFTAARDGGNPATLEVSSGNGSITIRD